MIDRSKELEDVGRVASSFSTYLGKIEETLLAGYINVEVVENLSFNYSRCMSNQNWLLYGFIGLSRWLNPRTPKFSCFLIRANGTEKTLMSFVFPFYVLISFYNFFVADFQGFSMTQSIINSPLGCRLKRSFFQSICGRWAIPPTL